MKTLQFLIDHICADFTVPSLLGLTRECLSRGQCTAEDIIEAIMRRDRSLDVKCAEGLAAGVLQFLRDNGEIQINDGVISALKQTDTVQ